MTRSRTRSTRPRFASAWAGALLVLGLAAGPAAAAFPGDDGRVSFTSTGDLFSVDAGGGGAPQRLTSTPEPEAQSAFSPDGARIAYRRRATTSTTDPLQVWVMAADGSAQHRVSGSDVQDTQPGWSPDGQQLVFRRTPRGGGNPAGDVWIMRADGTDVRPVIVTPDADERYPVLSPDGTRIAFTSNRGGNDYEIYVAGADGSNPQALTDDPGYDSAPSWSPDGQQIAFERGAVLDDDPSKDIWVMAADGTGQHQLTATAGVDEGPAWAPAGDAIAFTSGRQGTPDIFRMGVDGSNPRPVVTLDGLQESPDWQPLPRAPGPGPGPGPTPGAGPMTVPAPSADTGPMGATAPDAAPPAPVRRGVDRDRDDDGLSDAAERRLGTSPIRRDSDRDGLTDGVERGVRRGVSDPPGPDTGTRLSRLRIDRDPRTRTDPRRRDSDRDGRSDGREDANHNGRRDRGETDPRRADRRR